MLILAGDVGGSKIDLGLFSGKSGELELEFSRGWPSSRFSGFDGALKCFLKEAGEPRVDKACLGVAGPVSGGGAKITNLPWTISSGELSGLLRGAGVELINDLAAMSAGVPFLTNAQSAVLQDGEQARERIGVIAAGTGLGQACLQPDGAGGYFILESEGGQADFPPRGSDEAGLLSHLLKTRRRVCVEDVLSGTGLVAVYRHVVECERFEEPDWLAEELLLGDPPAVISARGMDGKSASCRRALDLFTGIYGGIAGNFALQFLTRGGVYIGGGIARKILPELQRGGFIEAFCAKGSFAGLMRSIPVRVILEERAALWGAAWFAFKRCFRR